MTNNTCFPIVFQQVVATKSSTFGDYLIYLSINLVKPGPMKLPEYDR